MNDSLRNASYQLSDGSLIIPGQKPSTPNLAAALRQHQAMRSPSVFHLPEKSVLTGAPRPTPPNLAAALRKDNLQGVTYRYGTTLYMESRAKDDLILTKKSSCKLGITSRPL